jgi:hypothetical protein
MRKSSSKVGRRECLSLLPTLLRRNDIVDIADIAAQ